MGEHILAKGCQPPLFLLNQVSHVCWKSVLKKEIKLWDKTGISISPFSMRSAFFTVDTVKRTFELVRKSEAFCTCNTLKTKKGHFKISGSLCNPDYFGYNAV